MAKNVPGNMTEASTTASKATTKTSTTETTKTSTSSSSWSNAPLDSLPRPPMWKVWLLASRPHTLTASLSPCLVGYAICRTYSFSNNDDDYDKSQGIVPPPISLSLLFLQMCLFCILIQLATNLHNDYADFIKGADTKDRVGPARATQRGWLSPIQTATAATICLMAALFIGLVCLMPTTTTTVDGFFIFFLLSSCFNAVAYTGGPYPLGYIGLGHVSIAYWGLGDLFCFLYFGYAAVMAQPYLLLRAHEAATAAANTDSSTTMASIVSILYYQRLPLGQALPAALLCTAIIVVNNLRDVHTDTLAQKRTVAVRCGIRFVQWEYTWLIVGTYISIVYMATSWWHILPCCTIPLAMKTTHAIWTKTGRDLNAYLGMTALLELSVCTLQSIGMIMAVARA